MSGQDSAIPIGRSGPILPRPRGRVLLGVAMVLIAFAASIAIGLMLAVRHNAALWEDHVSGRLTVQIMPEGTAPPPAEIASALALLRGTPGVVSADVMSASENAALVAPWMRSGETAAGLPFPALIDVKLNGGTTLDIQALKQRLLVSAPHALFDDPGRSIDAPTPLRAQTFWMAAVVLAVSALSFVLALAGMLRGWMAAQQHNVELLRLLGVSNMGIAGLIGRFSTAGVVLTAAAGSGLAASLFLLEAAGGKLAFLIPAPVPVVSPSDLPWLAFVPVTAAIITWVICHLLVWSALRHT